MATEIRAAAKNLKKGVPHDAHVPVVVLFCFLVHSESLVISVQQSDSRLPSTSTVTEI